MKCGATPQSDWSQGWLVRLEGVHHTIEIDGLYTDTLGNLDRVIIDREIGLFTGALLGQNQVVSEALLGQSHKEMVQSLISTISIIGT